MATQTGFPQLISASTVPDILSQGLNAALNLELMRRAQVAQAGPSVIYTPSAPAISNKTFSDYLPYIAAGIGAVVLLSVMLKRRAR